MRASMIDSFLFEQRRALIVDTFVLLALILNEKSYTNSNIPFEPALDSFTPSVVIGRLFDF